MSGERQRVDVWLWRARFAKTRAAATRLVNEGGVRLVRNGGSRQLEKPSAEIEVGDTLLIPAGQSVRVIEIAALPSRRGPAAEARALYAERDAEG